MAFILGITGGIGAGKSSVARLLAEFGHPLVDADAVSRSLTAAGGAAISRIRETFGPAFVTPEGALDRARMRTLVFAQPEERKKLEALLAPLLRSGILDALHRAAEHSGLVLFECPLLIERPRWREYVDRILVVDLEENVQIRRVQTRSGFDLETVLSIIRAQVPRTERLAAADDVIYNGSTPEALCKTVRNYHDRLLKSLADRASSS